MTTFATTGSEKSFAPDVRALAPADIVPDALIIKASTKVATLKGDEPVVRIPFAEFDGTDFVGEAATIPEDDVIDSEATISVRRLSLLFTCSREQWGQPDVADLLSAAAQRNLTRKANAVFLSHATAPLGVLNQSPFDAGPLGSNLDAVIDAVTHIEEFGGTPDLIVASPVAWSEVQKLKTESASNESLVGAGTTSATRQLLGLPVVVDRDAGNSLVVIDKSAVLSAYSAVEVASSEHFLFNANNVAVRLLWHVGQVVSDPDRVATVSVDTGSI